MPKPRRQGRMRHLASRPAVVRNDLAPGSIWWLPPEDEARDTPPLEPGCYNHPVVVLSVNQVSMSATVLLLTSFGCKNLETRHRGVKKQRLRGRYLPIHPSPPHPDNNIVLYLHDGQELRKQSYIGTNPRHTVAIRGLRPYRQLKLEKSSFLELTRYINDVTLKFPVAVQPENSPIHPPSRLDPSPVSLVAYKIDPCRVDDVRTCRRVEQCRQPDTARPFKATLLPSYYQTTFGTFNTQPRSTSERRYAPDKKVLIWLALVVVIVVLMLLLDCTMRKILSWV